MSYIAFSDTTDTFFVTEKVEDGVFMNGKLLYYERDAEALDMVDNLNSSKGKEPPLGVEVPYCAKHAHYNVDVKGQHTCSCI